MKKSIWFPWFLVIFIGMLGEMNVYAYSSGSVNVPKGTISEVYVTGWPYNTTNDETTQVHILLKNNAIFFLDGNPTGQGYVRKIVMIFYSMRGLVERESCLKFALLAMNSSEINFKVGGWSNFDFVDHSGTDGSDIANVYATMSGIKCHISR
jgi:hypothetical protein